jgi:urocanate hydratase
MNALCGEHRLILSLGSKCILGQFATNLHSVYSGYVQEIFDNVVSQVRRLVNDQITAVEEKEGYLPKVMRAADQTLIKVSDRA